MEFSFQADGRGQGAFEPALLWEVNRKQQKKKKNT